jgi:hypothetical protein
MNPSSDVTASLASATSVTIYLPPDPSFPLVAAGLGLYLSLKSKGTSVDIVCPTPMTVAMNQLVGIDQIQTKLPGQNLIISFDYVKDAIEKVSYNVENNKFNLLIQPRSGHQPLSADNVSFKLAGAPTDLIVLVGRAKVPGESQNISSISLVKNSDRSLTAETASLIKQTNLPLDQDIAGNLLRGLADETDRFSAATADDFAVAGELTRRGARLNPASTYAAARTLVDDRPQPVQWTGPKIFHSGDVI